MYPCDQCNYVGLRKTSLDKHKKFLCEKCDYLTNSFNNLPNITNSKHNGILFPLYECSFVGTRLNSVKVHNESQHKPPQFLCDQCDYRATLPKFLKAQIDSDHEKIRYPCNSCENAPTSKSNLRQHTRFELTK